LNNTPALRKQPIAALLFEAVKEGGRCRITENRKRRNAEKVIDIPVIYL
jgi:hypothetical protein